MRACTPGPFGLLRSVTTIEELYIQGFEADFNFIANDVLSFYGGIGLLDSEIEENRNRPLSEGNDVPQAPDITGNLGAQLRRLEEAGYVAVDKEFVKRKPVSWYSLEPAGRSALGAHLVGMQAIIRNTVPGPEPPGH